METNQMKSLAIPFAATLTILGTTPAIAQQLAGATVELTYNSSSDLDYSSTAVAGSVETGYLSFGLQLDAAFASVYDNNEQWTGYGVHAFYNVTPEIAVGLFAAQYEVISGDYIHYGLEGKARFQNIEVEAYIGENTGDGAFEFETWGIHAAYAVLPQLDVFARYDYYDAADRNGRSIGAVYELTPGLELEASLGSYHYPSGTQDNMGLAVRYDFGSGVTFQRREWWALYPNF